MQYGQHVDVVEALKAQLAQLAQRGAQVLLQRHRRADVVHAPAAPAGLVHGQRAGLELDDVALVPAVRDAVGVRAVGVAGDAVAQRLAVRDQLAQTLLAAQRLLHGEHLRPSAVVAAHVPAHQAQLRLLDALPLHLLHQFLHLREGAGDVHGRLGLERLLQHRGGHGLPAHADADQRHAVHRVAQHGVVLRALGKRNKLLFLHGDGAIPPRDAAVVRVRARQLDYAQRDVLVQVDARQVIGDGQRIAAAADVQVIHIVVPHAVDEHHQAFVAQLCGEEGQYALLGDVLLVRAVGEEGQEAVLVAVGDVVALVACLRIQKRKADGHKLCVCGYNASGYAVSIAFRRDVEHFCGAIGLYFHLNHGFSSASADCMPGIGDSILHETGLNNRQRKAIL